MPELIFIHNPKTGGLSFLHTLNEVYGQENVKQIWDLLPWHDSILHTPDSIFYREYAHFLQITHKALEEAPEYKVLHGHMPAFVIDGFYPGAKRIAWVRHPIDQVLSRVFHFRKERLNDAHHWVSPWALATEPIFRNCQSFYLGNSLRQFDFVGVLEHYNEDFKTCCDLMGWTNVEPVHYHPTEHETDRRCALECDMDFLEHMAGINLLDFMLYDQVRELRGTWS